MNYSPTELGRILALVHQGHSEASEEADKQLFETVKDQAASVDVSSVLNGDFGKYLKHESQPDPDSVETSVAFYHSLFQQDGATDASASNTEELVLYLNNNFHFFERFTEVVRGYQMSGAAR